MDSFMNFLIFGFAMFMLVIVLYSFVYESKLRRGQSIRHGFLYSRLRSIMSNWQAKNMNFWFMLLAMVFFLGRAISMEALTQAAIWLFVIGRLFYYRSRYTAYTP